MSEQTDNLEPEQITTVIDRVLPSAAAQTPSEFRRAVRKAVSDIDPEALKRRAKEAKKDRRVWMRELADGMAEHLEAGCAPIALLNVDVLQEKESALHPLVANGSRRVARELPCADERIECLEVERACCRGCFVHRGLLCKGLQDYQVIVQVEVRHPAARPRWTGASGSRTPRSRSSIW